MSDIFGLFDSKLKDPKDLVASPAQNLQSLSGVEEEQDFFVEKAKRFERVDLKVDYSDFTNFVFFNSALDYFNISGEKVLNDYPFDGSRVDLERFLVDLDGYQRYLLSTWPKRVGHLRFDPSLGRSYIKVEDVGYEFESATKGAVLSPNTGSFSVEGWYKSAGALTGTADVQVIVQKSNQTGDGFTVYLTGSDLRFRVVSGSSVNEVVAPGTGSSQAMFFSCVCDRSNTTGSIYIATGSVDEYPVMVSSASLGFYSSLNIGSCSLYIGSGTLSSKTTVLFTGSLDDVRVWKKARSLQELSSSYNSKTFAQSGLAALWRFNESGSIPSISGSDGDNSLVIDHSGHKLNGRIVNYFSAIRGSGSLFKVEDPDPILFVNSSDVRYFVVQQQLTASSYDDQNDKQIVNLIPQKFLELEDSIGENVLRNFLYVLGRFWDNVKLHIDQYLHVLSVNYGEFDQTPDALLGEVAKFFGWEFTGNFLNASAMQYMLGKGVSSGPAGNQEFDVKLYEIKNQFWRRVLNNLSYLYKTKGTKESISSLLRLYGANDNFVRIKEYGYFSEHGLKTHRIESEKTSYALVFGSGSYTGSVQWELPTSVTYPVTSSFTVETRLRFPLTSSSDLTPTVLTGSIWGLFSGSTSPTIGWGVGSWGVAPWGYMGIPVTGTYEAGDLQFYFVKNSISSSTGSFYLANGSNNLIIASLTGASVFDDKWCNVVVRYDASSGSYSILVKRVEEGEITVDLSSSFPYPTSFAMDAFILGTFPNGFSAGDYWSQEVRLWKRKLSRNELRDHALNYQSIGQENLRSNDGSLVLHWRLNADTTGSENSWTVTDYSMNGNGGVASGFSPHSYKKFLNEYNYIVPADFGWTQDKTRVFDTSELSPSQSPIDNRVLALEFNMIDALNEDITQIMESLDEYEQIVCLPTSRYKETYDGLQQLRKIYFKRLQGRLNFTAFSDMLEFFDRTFIDMVRQLVPARALFMGDEFVVESHMLERPKVQYNRRIKQDEFVKIEGRIAGTGRFGAFPLYLPGGGQ